MAANEVTDELPGVDVSYAVLVAGSLGPLGAAMEVAEKGNPRNDEDALLAVMVAVEAVYESVLEMNALAEEAESSVVKRMKDKDVKNVVLRAVCSEEDVVLILGPPYTVEENEDNSELPVTTPGP